MTNKQAIELLKWFGEYNDIDYHGGDMIENDKGDRFYRIVEEDLEAFDMAIKALSQQTEYHGTEDMDGLYYCPICQQTTTVVKDGNKCPKCGTTMDELSTREQTEDTISRQEVQDLLATWLSDYLTDETREALETIDGKVGDMPSVTPKQRRENGGVICID